MNKPFSQSNYYTLSLPVEGMTCASCVGRVERALANVPGVSSANVNLATEKVEVSSYAPLDKSALAAAIEKAGYTVPAQTVDIAIEGMTCASCVARVERALEAVPGVTSAMVNLATERATVTGSADAAALVQAIEKTGYDARLVENTGAEDDALASRKEAEEALLRRDLTVAAVLTLPVFALEMGSHLFAPVHHLIMSTIGMQTSWVVQFILTTLVLAGPGRRFYRKGYPALLRAAPDMNSLVAVGTTAAYAYSLVATFLPGLLPANTVNVYYEAAAVIVTLILLGRYLEARAKGRTSQAISRLVGLQPRMAQVHRGDTVVEVAISEVRAGDVLDLRPGARVPVDGEVISGHSWIDESMITGEPAPVAKSAGALVTGGTVNQNGALTFRATAVGEATMLAQIIRMVEAAQSGKLPIQALVDKITLWFVPVVMGLAVLTFAIWLIFGPDPALTFGLVNAVAVLIIACPCAMGLATPTSIMVGTGRGAELGVLFRKGEALQALQGVRVVALDKTGTLTAGKPTLTDLIVAPGFDRAGVLASVAAVEARSEHPIAEAIVTAAQDDGLTLPDAIDFASETGFGVSAKAAGQSVHIGADRYMRKFGLDVAIFAEVAARMGQEGKSPLYAAIDSKLAAILAVADPIKPSTPAAIRALHDLGLNVAMITGDNAGTAQAIARQLGIDAVVAEVLPGGKVKAIQSLRVNHGPLAFVGDGINDAPALAEADVGIAIGTGTDIAIEAADVVLISGRLTGVPEAIGLSRATMGNIKQNLFWAFVYNAALIPLAAGTLYPAFGILLSPIFAAGAMTMSSVFVLGNALRLRRFQPTAVEGETA
ncbi:heavy metal translocating P-type ATPase [Seohaeicola saemankumensis]|uniref:heavy metal translocating P-type ATPase n=1 Tax=Seohaeicola TaxID=481178 RepID=UPI0035CFE2ED